MSRLYNVWANGKYTWTEKVTSLFLETITDWKPSVLPIKRDESNTITINGKLHMTGQNGLM